MRIYLQSKNNETGVIRFVHLILQEELMGGWTLIREAGKQGSSGSIKREHYDNLEDALDAMSKWRNKNINRGYSVAFVEGVKAP